MSRTLIIAAVAAFDLVGPTSIAWVQKAGGTLVQMSCARKWVCHSSSSHDQRVAATVCEKIAVKSKGNWDESGSTAAIFANPQPPYTRSLLAAVPGKEWAMAAGNA